MINHTDNKNASPTNKTIKARIPFLLCSIQSAPFNLKRKDTLRRFPPT